MIGNKIDRRYLRRTAAAMLLLCTLLSVCTAGVMRADLDATVAAQTALNTGKELAHLSSSEYLGVTVIVLSVALVSINFVFFRLLAGIGAKIAAELAALSAERARSIEAREYCERHSGKLQAEINAKEARR